MVFSQEKIREGESTIKSIQILFNDFKKNNSDCINWDEFKRSEREFNELVDVFNQIVNPNQNKQYDNMSDDSERDEYVPLSKLFANIIGS